MNDSLAKIANLSVGRIAIFSFIITLVYFFTVYDSGSTIATEIENVKSQVAAESAKKAETENILKKEEQMRADVAVLAKTYEEVKAKIPTEFESAELRSIVEKASNDNQLRILKLRNKEKSETDFANKAEDRLVEHIEIEFVFEGTYSQIVSFAQQLSQTEKVVRMSDFKVEVSKAANGPSKTLTLDTVIVGYKQVLETEKKEAVK